MSTGYLWDVMYPRNLIFKFIQTPPHFVQNVRMNCDPSDGCHVTGLIPPDVNYSQNCAGEIGELLPEINRTTFHWNTVEQCLDLLVVISFQFESSDLCGVALRTRHRPACGRSHGNGPIKIRRRVSSVE